MDNKEIQQQINNITKQLSKGNRIVFRDLETIKLICINVKISVAKLGDNPEAKALSEIGDIITEAVNKIEEYTNKGEEIYKQIEQLINQLQL